MRQPQSLFASCRSVLLRARRVAPALLIAVASPGVMAQGNPASFPADAVRFLDAEVPAMNAAVAAQDREYFEGAMARTLELADQWGFKTRANPALEPYRACTEAVTDMVVVGLCKLTPGASDCTSQLASGFDRNAAACRSQAGR